jgi:hypothetical protein
MGRLKLCNPHLQLNTPLPNGNRLMAQQAEGPGVALCPPACRQSWL